MRPLPSVIGIEPLAHPFDVEVSLPGSKSLTNRALVCAALAPGISTLRGALDADDTLAMRDCVRVLGADVDDSDARSWRITGVTQPRSHREPRVFDVRESGTTGRFIAPVAALSAGHSAIVAAPSMAARPMASVFDALVGLGVQVDAATAGRLPATLRSPGVTGGEVDLSDAASVSSQFVSGLLLAGGAMPGELSIHVRADQVSASYIEMTISVMERFGAHVERDEGVMTVGGGYRPVDDFEIEPDASAASYFLAAASVTRSRVTVVGLGRRSVQGDLGFAGLLGSIGASVSIGENATVVEGVGDLRGTSVDMSDISDTMPTLAAIAGFSTGATTVTGIGFVRGKETDRIAAVVTELRRCGLDAVEDEDGFRVEPAMPGPAVIRTYGDHRMAMSFAVTGLVAPGIAIADPSCVAKTFPGFFDELARLRVGR